MRVCSPLWDNAITGPAVWSGNEMLIYGEGLAFDPASEEWRWIPPPSGPERSFEVTVWTGTELVVWGGCDALIRECDDFGQGIFTDGIAYDPAADRWRELAPSPLAPGVHPKGVWTGSEVLIYAGTASPDNGPTAAAYDPAADPWREVPDPPMAPRRYASAAWTGQHFVLWGGSKLGTEFEFGDGVAYHPQEDTWLAVSPTPEGSERDRHAMVWIQDQLYIIGGWRTNGPLVFTQARRAEATHSPPSDQITQRFE
jgi:N-acetylneuraminic acid mutarotase